MTDDTIAELRGRGADGYRFAALVELFLAGKPLAVALAAARRAGAASMRRVRDDALRAVVAHVPGPVAVRVRELRHLVRGYQTTRWRADRNRAAMPPKYVGTIDEHLYTALAAGAGKVPLSRTQLYQILTINHSASGESSVVSGRAEAEDPRVEREDCDAGDGDAARPRP